MKFTMTQEQFDTMMDACKPTPYMVIGGVAPRSPQENATAAWVLLGQEMGFDWNTVSPCGNDPKTFNAEPLTESASL